MDLHIQAIVVLGGTSTDFVQNMNLSIVFLLQMP